MSGDIPSVGHVLAGGALRLNFDIYSSMCEIWGGMEGREFSTFHVLGVGKVGIELGLKSKHGIAIIS